MSEQHDESPPSGRRDVAVALARMEAKLDVAIAQHSARLDEHGRRIGEATAAISEVVGRVGLLEQQHAADDARSKSEADARVLEAASRPERTGTAGWIGLGISVLLALYVIIDHIGAASP